MKDNLKIIIVLTGISVICGFALAFVYTGAKEKIEANERRYIYQAINNIAPTAKDIKEQMIENKKVYKLFDNEGTLTSYVYLYEGNGYQGKIKILFAVNRNLNKLLGIEIIESVETPGLGARINEPDFKGQFKERDITRKIECVKYEPRAAYQVQAITSATVSSKAVVNILNEGIDELKSIIKTIKQ